MNRVALLLAGLVLATGCSDPAVLGDEAACPGATCTDDVRERLETIAALDGVTRVAEVSRSYGFDRGAFRSAVVEAEVADVDEAREVALAVLRELDRWPGQDPGTAEATVVADPRTTIKRAAREVEDVPAYYETCARDCRAELATVRDRLAAELEGVYDLAVEVTGGRLQVTGRAEPEQAVLAARGVLTVLSGEAVALAERVEVTFSYRMPLEVTWRLVEGQVCEQPPGEAVVVCDENNSITLVNVRYFNLKRGG